MKWLHGSRDRSTVSPAHHALYLHALERAAGEPEDGGLTNLKKLLSEAIQDVAATIRWSMTSGRYECRPGAARPGAVPGHEVEGRTSAG
jgi:hypothetical protein